MAARCPLAQGETNGEGCHSICGQASQAGVVNFHKWWEATVIDADAFFSAMLGELHAHGGDHVSNMREASQASSSRHPGCLGARRIQSSCR